MANQRDDQTPPSEGRAEPNKPDAKQGGGPSTPNPSRRPKTQIVPPRRQPTMLGKDEPTPPPVPAAFPNMSLDEPIEAEPIEVEPIEVEALEAEPIEEEPIKAEALEAEPIEAEALEAEPIEAEPIEAELIEADVIEAEPLEAEPIEAVSVASGVIEAVPVTSGIIDAVVVEDDPLVIEAEPISAVFLSDVFASEPISVEPISAAEVTAEESTARPYLAQPISVTSESMLAEPISGVAEEEEVLASDLIEMSEEDEARSGNVLSADLVEESTSKVNREAEGVLDADELVISALSSSSVPASQAMPESAVFAEAFVDEDDAVLGATPVKGPNDSFILKNTPAAMSDSGVLDAGEVVAALGSSAVKWDDVEAASDVKPRLAEREQTVAFDPDGEHAEDFLVPGDASVDLGEVAK